MTKKIRHSAILNPAAGTADGIIEFRRQEALLKTRALQNAVLNSANFSSIVTDEKGVIQVHNVGAERTLGYEVIARTKALNVELEAMISPGIEDIYELSCTREDGSYFLAIMSVTTLRDTQNAIIGYLLIGTYNTARKQTDNVLLRAETTRSAVFQRCQFPEDGFNICDGRFNKSDSHLTKRRSKLPHLQP